MGLLCSFSGCLINHHLETVGDIKAENDEGSSQQDQSFTDHIKYNYKVCKNAFKEKIFYMALLFFTIEGFTVPNFFEFVYYYATNEAKMTQE